MVATMPARSHVEQVVPRPDEVRRIIYDLSHELTVAKRLLALAVTVHVEPPVEAPEPVPCGK